MIRWFLLTVTALAPGAVAAALQRKEVGQGAVGHRQGQGSADVTSEARRKAPGPCLDAGRAVGEDEPTPRATNYSTLWNICCGRP
jgi:hypothetical protein